MSLACQYLHETLAKWPRFSARFDPGDIPDNGLYFLFERGETAHGRERIVRIGTHTGQNNLAKRLKEHLYTTNKDRSIFRKHIGRCLLAQRNAPFIEYWEIDLTTRKEREKWELIIDKQRLAETEKMVSEYINDYFSFTVLSVKDKNQRLRYESGLLSAIAQCPECKASTQWLGSYHPNTVIRNSGLWNIQGLNNIPFTIEEIDLLLSKADIE